MPKNTNYEDKITMKFNILQLNRTIVALLNNGYNKKFAGNVLRLFNLFRPASYANEYAKEVRVYLIKNIANLILTKNITEKETILNFLEFDGRFQQDCEDIIEDLKYDEIPENELTALDTMVSNQLKYSVLEESSDKLIQLMTALKTETYDNLDEHIKKLGEEISGIDREIKCARESIEDAKSDVSLSSSGQFLNFVDEVIQKERNPSTRVKTGIQYLNATLNGGFEKGRTYIFCAVAKGWKSGLLLSTAIWAKKYNTFKTKDPSRTPVILYLSMENSNEETLTRLWCNCFGNDSKISDYSKVEAANMLKNAGVFTPDDPNSAELVIMYRSNRSINTSDLNAILEDFKRNGKEVVFLVLDYLKRIRPTETNKDQRLELSNITDELKTIATEQDIPVVTGHQLNREAFKALEEATTFDEKIHAADKLGASNIGESINVVQNCDTAFIINRLINRAVNDDGDVEYRDRYLFVKQIASRVKQSDIISFKHRFKENNDMALIDDIMLSKPLSTNTEIEFIKDRQAQYQQKTNRKII